uniref:Uncharacterized protein n=1 Tax=Bactrocera dorsalis TaxID=27457 RepID=A0A034W9Q9_BACDO
MRNGSFFESTLPSSLAHVSPLQQAKALITATPNQLERYSLEKSMGRSQLPQSMRYNSANCVAMPPLHNTCTQLRWPSPSLKSFSNFRFKCARNLVARDEVKKNAAKLAKNAWLAMDKMKENIIPSAAPDLLTDFLRSAIVISVSGANVENSQRVGGMTGGSSNSFECQNFEKAKLPSHINNDNGMERLQNTHTFKKATTKHF